MRLGLGRNQVRLSLRGTLGLGVLGDDDQLGGLGRPKGRGRGGRGGRGRDTPVLHLVRGGVDEEGKRESH